jgi:hypothetical protein
VPIKDPTNEEILEALLKVSTQVTQLVVDYESIDTKISNAVRAEVNSRLPFDHTTQHDLMREHLSHSPNPKEHGEQHVFTKTLQDGITVVIGTALRGIGYIILLAFLLGSWVWVNEMAAEHGMTRNLVPAILQSHIKEGVSQ